MLHHSTLPRVRWGCKNNSLLSWPACVAGPLTVSSLQVPVLCQQRLPLPLVQVPKPLHTWPHHLFLPGRQNQCFRGKKVLCGMTAIPENQLLCTADGLSSDLTIFYSGLSWSPYQSLHVINKWYYKIKKEATNGPPAEAISARLLGLHFKSVKVTVSWD